MLSEREPEAGEPAWIEAGEHVRLVLGVVGSTREQEGAVALDNACVVACGEPLRADSARKGQKLCEAKTAVTAHARVRCLATRIAPDERRHDGPTELFAEVKREVRKAQTVARIAGRGDGRGRAAHALGVRAAGVCPEPQGHAHGLEALIASAQ